MGAQEHALRFGGGSNAQSLVAPGLLLVFSISVLAETFSSGRAANV
ncbi:MAG: hypothetical protein ABWY38_06895 [Methyloceanibacter sp.]